jgi:hypothetical protein
VMFFNIFLHIFVRPPTLGDFLKHTA